MDGKTGETGKVKRIQIIDCISRGSYCSAARKLFCATEFGKTWGAGKDQQHSCRNQPRLHVQHS
eukprot:13199788-Heterocapsa_arctica.AAC.1